VPRRVDLDLVLGILLVLLALTATLSVAVSQAVLGAALVVLVLRWARGRSPRRAGVEWPALALVAWALAVIPFSHEPGQSALYARRWYLLVPIWVGASAIGALGGSWRRHALIALAAGAVASAALGFWSFVRKGGAHYRDDGQLAGRAEPLAGYMTGAGLLMLVGLVLLAALLLVRSSRWRLWVLAALAIVGTGLLLTLTRSAWLGFAAGAALIVALWRARWLAALAAVGVVVILLLPGALKTRLLSAFDPADRANAQRVLMWQTGWQWVQEHPLTGVGDCDYKNLYRAHHAGDPDVEIQGHLHSNLVMFATAWGVPGFLLAVGFLAAVLWRLWRRWRRLSAAMARRGPPAPAPDGPAVPADHLDLARIWCLGAMGAWVGLMVAGLFEWNFGDAEVALLLWLIVGLGLGRAPDERAADQGAPDEVAPDGGVPAHGEVAGP